MLQLIESRTDNIENDDKAKSEFQYLIINFMLRSFVKIYTRDFKY